MLTPYGIGKGARGIMYNKSRVPMRSDQSVVLTKSVKGKGPSRCGLRRSICTGQREYPP